MESDDSGSDILLAMGIEKHADTDSRCESDILVEHSDYVASHQDETIDILEAMGVAHAEACDVVRRASSDGKPEAPLNASLHPHHHHHHHHHFHPSLRTIDSVGNIGNLQHDVPATSAAAPMMGGWMTKVLVWVARLFARKH